MKELNLLPVNIKIAERNKKKLTILIIILSAILILSVISFIWLLDISKERNSVLSQINIELKNDKYTMAQNQLDELLQLKNDISLYSQKVSAIKIGTPKSEIFQQISKVLPTGVLLTQVSIDGSNSVEIYGVANSRKLALNYLTNLNSITSTSNVSLRSLGFGKEKVDFAINVTFAESEH